ncbi:hypothetical protein K1719_041666 [Acacia pycnantha]|nr:hypothetical protein K1719_041666 [Acacia pycnantha]
MKKNKEKGWHLSRVQEESSQMESKAALLQESSPMESKKEKKGGTFQKKNEESRYISRLEPKNKAKAAPSTAKRRRLCLMGTPKTWLN